jgi:hypothetical protein
MSISKIWCWTQLGLYWLKVALLIFLVTYIAVHFVELNVYIHTNPGSECATQLLLTLVGLASLYVLLSAINRRITGCSHEVASIWVTMSRLLRRQHP